jgi:hypothetical protein
MNTVAFSIRLPELLVREAEAVGLKLPRDFERLIHDELRRRNGKDFLSIADRIAALNIPPMSHEEIQAEIDAVRSERRAQP